MFVATAVMMCGGAFTANAQTYLEDPKWGDTPEQRTENALEFNYLRDAYNMKDYDGAVPFLQNMLNNAPQASQNIYVYGANIYKNKAAKSTSLKERNMFVDSLVMIYDMRAANFPDDIKTTLRNKAVDYLNFRPLDKENIIKYFDDAAQAQGDDLDAAFINMYFNELTEGYKADLVEADKYMTTYDRLDAIMKQLQASGAEDMDQALTTFEALFITSGAANCDNLEKMFSKRVADDPENVDILDKAFKYMARANCKSDFFFDVAEKLYAKAPSTDIAIRLAEGYELKKEYSKALSFLNAILAKETDPDLRMGLYIRIAASELGSGNSRAAAENAKHAIDINPESGLAYFMLANAYIGGLNGCAEFNKSAACWLIYDTLAKAKQNSKPDEFGNIDSMMASYRGYFPTAEECFFRSLNDGDRYVVNCGWISGATTVRSRR
jgi:tetratricopeptide (TPR) repeat protein